LVESGDPSRGRAGRGSRSLSKVFPVRKPSRLPRLGHSSVPGVPTHTGPMAPTRATSARSGAVLAVAVRWSRWLVLAVVVLSLVPVLVLSLVHFALGELEFIRETSGWRPGRVVTAALAVAGTGALLLPLARAGRQLAGVASSVSPELGLVLASGPVRITLVAVW